MYGDPDDTPDFGGSESDGGGYPDEDYDSGDDD